MNYNNIKNFHTVVELKSLVAAAKYLHISQPALSKSIKNLEEELCCQLFTHAKNKMQLNENGQKYYDFTKKYFSLHQKLVDELRTSNGINSSHLQISFGSAGNIIPLLTHDFKQLYPQCTFTLRTKVPNIIDTNSHFIFTATKEELISPHYYLLFREPLYLTLSIENHLAKYKTLQLANLSEELFLLPNPANDMYAIQLHYYNMAGFTPHSENIIEKNNVLLTLIALNMGVTLMPTLHNSALTEQRLTQIPISDIPCWRYVYLIENTNVYQTNMAQAFKRFCLSYKY